MLANIIWDFDGNIPMSDKTSLKTATIPTKSGNKPFIGFFKGNSFVVVSAVKMVEIVIEGSEEVSPEEEEEEKKEKSSAEEFPVF